jgi:hypothetical protein
MAVLGVRRITQVPEQHVRDGLACGGVLLQEGSQATSTQPLQVELVATAAAAAAANSNQYGQCTRRDAATHALTVCLSQHHCMKRDARAARLSCQQCPAAHLSALVHAAVVCLSAAVG